MCARRRALCRRHGLFLRVWRVAAFGGDAAGMLGTGAAGGWLAVGRCVAGHTMWTCGRGGRAPALLHMPHGSGTLTAVSLTLPAGRGRAAASEGAGLPCGTPLCKIYMLLTATWCLPPWHHHPSPPAVPRVNRPHRSSGWPCGLLGSTPPKKRWVGGPLGALASYRPPHLGTATSQSRHLA